LIGQVLCRSLVVVGYQTDFVGYLEIEPPLEERERSLVNRISGSVFMRNADTGLRVADGEDELLRDLMRDAPRGWSNWTACPQGCCLSYDGGDKANHMVPWLEFLMATLLVGSRTALGGDAAAGARTVNGMVIGSRRDNRELYSITVRNNVVRVELLWPGRPEWSDYPPLAYQTRIDGFRAWVRDQEARE
jgi:hypothetical protein